jgi:potassium-dependent mechanosensitive channel
VSVQYRRLQEWCLLAGLALATWWGLSTFAAAQATPPAATAQPSATPRPSEAATPSAPGPAGEPQVALPKNLADALARLSTSLEGAEKALQHLNNVEEDLSRLRINVEDILSDASQTAEALRPELALVRTQIEKLGPPPAKDAPAEAPAIAAERARLSALASQLDGAIKSTELTWVRARQLIERITVMRHAIFTKNLMERLPSPLLPGLWRDLFNEAPGVIHRFNYLAEDWLRWAEQKRLQLSLLFVAVVLLFIVLWRLTTRLTGRRVIGPESPPPSFFERAKAVAWVAPLKALAAVAAAMLLYGGLDALGLLYPPWVRAGAAILKAVVVFSAVAALINGVLAPNEPNWRLVALCNASARRIARLLIGMAAVYAVDVALTEISRAFFVPLTLSVVQSFTSSTAFAALLIGVLLTPFAPQDGAAGISRHYPRLLKLPLWVVAIAIIATALAGYVALARFLAQQLVLTGIVVVVGWLAYLAIRAVTREPAQRSFPVGEILESRFGLDAPRRNQLTRLTELALTLAVIIAAIPLLMLQWGFSGADIRDWFTSILFGMEVGQFRISLARILLGIILFIALLFATRLFQRWLREKALQQTRMDPGIVNSIDTVVGYACIAFAALLALSYAGFDITNLAIVAGALSVGIGFGLQSIVNNFVSGLILLIERPIKVGDRIVVGDQQGLVRRISVRATEIETFDRASLIVPNSELITGRVLNWTHRDSLVAVSVKVGVSYAADPEQVIDILRKCALDHPDVLRFPEPSAVFENFGDSALMFELRVSLPEISKAVAVQSALRTAIFKALRAANIEIPFNQIDVNLRDLEGLRRELAQLARAQRAGKDAPEVDEPAAGEHSSGNRVTSTRD